MSQLEVDKIIPQSGTTLTIGDSGDTVTFADGTSIGIDTNTLYIDSTNNRVGIGTSSPSVTLDVNGGTANTVAKFTSTDSNCNIGIFDNSTTGIYLSAIGDDFTIKTASSERMRIDSSGKVGIGTTTLTYALNIKESTGNMRIKTTDGQNVANASTSILEYHGTDNRAGYVGFVGGDMVVHTDTYSAGDIKLQTNGSERMRIDSSGNLLVGKTSDSFAGEGLVFSPGSASTITRDDGNVISIRRDTSDGDIIKLYKDTTNVGNIGAIGGTLSIGTGDTGIRFNDGGDNIFAFNTSTSSTRDNAVDLGASGGRWKDLYLGGGLYVGGTGSANKLDDYEQGTFTPVLEFGNATTGITYSNRDGMYVKVGELVMIQIFIELSNKGSASGDATISGLPFTMRTLSNGWSGVGAGSMTWTNFASRIYSILTNPNRNTQELGISGVTNSSGEFSAQALNSGDFNNNTYFGITVSYRTT